MRVQPLDPPPASPSLSGAPNTPHTPPISRFPGLAETLGSTHEHWRGRHRRAGSTLMTSGGGLVCKYVLWAMAPGCGGPLAGGAVSVYFFFPGNKAPPSPGAAQKAGAPAG